MTSTTGHFIVVEGLEGAGKTSALDTIKLYLAKYVAEIISTREPGGTRVGELVRTLIKESICSEPLDLRSELLLLYAARVQLLEQIIYPALNRGCWVIGDRFELSTLAYQGGGRKLDSAMILHLSRFCLQGFQPDLIIFLDIDPAHGLKRAGMRGKLDRMERESLEFFTAVYQGYHEYIKTMKQVVIIDASKPLVVVQAAICKELKHYLHNLNIVSHV